MVNTARYKEGGKCGALTVTRTAVACANISALMKRIHEKRRHSPVRSTRHLTIEERVGVEPHICDPKMAEEEQAVFCCGCPFRAIAWPCRSAVLELRCVDWPPALSRAHNATRLLPIAQSTVGPFTDRRQCCANLPVHVPDMCVGVF